ncbi:hypothetical protein V5O48_004903 [Marasmius crinis-equi]|uniref:Uncharacterized protein n=1 Tax=Marasmius crinis-equi TaxID=585013 RepID=A0ABR3FNR2_9AGAR
MSFPNSQGATFNDGQFNNITGDVMSFFSNSHGATFYDGQFNNVAGNQYNNNNNNNTYSTLNHLRRRQPYKHSGKQLQTLEQHTTQKLDIPNRDAIRRLVKKYDGFSLIGLGYGRGRGGSTGFTDLQAQESQL